MTVHKLSARVVCWECEGQAAASKQSSDVTVCRVEAGGSAIPDIATSANDAKAMAMQVDGVRKLGDAGGLNPLVVPLL